MRGHVRSPSSYGVLASPWVRRQNSDDAEVVRGTEASGLSNQEELLCGSGQGQWNVGVRPTAVTIPMSLTKMSILDLTSAPPVYACSIRGPRSENMNEPAAPWDKHR